PRVCGGSLYMTRCRELLFFLQETVYELVPESKGAWDLYKVLETIPAEQAFRPMSEGGCPMLADMTAK
ncbi:hypothetical protein, partial [Methylobacterium radiotolerans]|uniref:hypothetical protein n=1 Tax=Methylobacterium radiotolerans TaxID=31998 RepID=UPI001AEC7D53